MARSDYYVTQNEIQQNGLQHFTDDRMNVTPAQAKLEFDKLPTLIAERHNDTVDFICDTIDSTNTETFNHFNDVIFSSAATSIDSRLTVLENNTEHAPVDGGSMFSVTDTSEEYADISEGTYSLAGIVGMLASNTNALNSRLDTTTTTITGNVETLISSTARVSGYEVETDADIDEITTAGTYLVKNGTNLPGEMFFESGADAWLTVKRESSTDDEIHQEVQSVGEYEYNSSILCKASASRKSSDGGSTWGEWSYSGITRRNIVECAKGSVSSIRLGNLVICMGASSITPIGVRKQTNKEITYPVTYKMKPYLYFSLQGGTYVDTCNLTPKYSTVSGFTASLYADNKTERPFNWIAIGVI